MKRILVIDVGGTNIKVSTSERRESLKIPSGKAMTAGRMAAEVRKAIEGWKYDAVSIGYPGAVKGGRPAHEPHNLSGGWMRFDYQKAFGAPVKIVNDAAMQALGAYGGGRMLFLGLGTGLGSALVAEGLLMPLELAHLPYRRGRTYEDYVGVRGFVRLGRKKWTRHVHEVVDVLKAGLPGHVPGKDATDDLDALLLGAFREGQSVESAAERAVAVLGLEARRTQAMDRAAELARRRQARVTRRLSPP